MTPLLEPVPGVPVHLVVMGVAGCGKSTIARALHQRLGWEFAEGDEFHPQSNREKMASGRPLMDADRWPWLKALAGWTGERDERGESTILSCSALRRSYRDLLGEGGPGTFFVHMHGDKGLLLDRMESRDHFMPPALLESQLDTLELLEPDERGIEVDIAHPVGRAVRIVVAHLE